MTLRRACEPKRRDLFGNYQYCPNLTVYLGRYLFGNYQHRPNLTVYLGRYLFGNYQHRPNLNVYFVIINIVQILMFIK